jgi:hypothetical protein
MVLQNRPQPVREGRDLSGPGRPGVCLAVDLGEHRVEYEVIELFFTADVPVQRAGYHAEAGGDSAHAEGLRAIGADDRERLGDNALAGERGAAAIPLVYRAEPQRSCVSVFRLLSCHAGLPAGAV